MTADGEFPRTDAELEDALRDLGGHIMYPPTPNLAAGVRVQLDAHPPLRRLWPRSVLASALLAATFMLGIILALSPTVRTAVAHFLGVPGITIRWGGSTPGPIGQRLHFGQAVSLTEARKLVSFTILVPDRSIVGEPDQVYLDSSRSGGEVSLVYRAGAALPPMGKTRIGLLLSEFRSESDEGYIKEQLRGPLTPVVVRGRTGFWLQGKHVLYYRDASGHLVKDSTRLASNTLLWHEASGVTFRLESNLSRAEALRIAQSLR